VKVKPRLAFDKVAATLLAVASVAVAVVVWV
jgi:hypothetical protein